MQFSDLAVDFSGSTNPLYQRVNELRARGADLVDLVHGGPNAAGIFFPAEVLNAILEEATRRAREYKPDSLGQEPARAAIAAYAHNIPEHILLTPGTSISYWYAFRLLAEPGDQILCPTPSYPLFEYIARMNSVELTAYRMDEDREWEIDLDYLEGQVSERTRAIVLISPHNPTGRVANRSELEALGRMARKHDIAVISDEVFREFTFDDSEALGPKETDAPLVLTLNGFSKMFALPGMKIGWISVSGDASQVSAAIRTLEMMSDTFLPVNEIAQFAVPGIFERGGEFLSDYKRQIESARNLAVTEFGDAMGARPQGGFYCVIPFGREIEEEDLAIELINEEQVLVHPGYFYEVEGRHLVLSFVGKEERVGDAIRRMKPRLV